MQKDTKKKQMWTLPNALPKINFTHIEGNLNDWTLPETTKQWVDHFANIALTSKGTRTHNRKTKTISK